MEIRIAHSPDSDDAFMFYGLAAEKVDSGPYRFTHRLEDIESLNEKAMHGEYEVTAISIHAYAYVSDQYALLSSGASMGEGYGPMVVARAPLGGIRGKTIAVPGRMTTAYLALRLFEPDFFPIVLPFDRIMEAVQAGAVDGGVLIHEGQLTYAREGLSKEVDLGVWWHDTTGLPLPLGGNAIRRDLGRERIAEISKLLRQSIQYGLDHRSDALAHAQSYARGLAPAEADTFVGMYVNARTLDYGDDGRRAVQLLLDRAHEQGLVPHHVSVEFV